MFLRSSESKALSFDFGKVLINIFSSRIICSDNVAVACVILIRRCSYVQTCSLDERFPLEGMELEHLRGSRVGIEVCR